MSASLSTAHQTEHRLLKVISDVREEAGYALFRSDEFPRFYGGNFLEVRALASASDGDALDRLKRIYCAHFDQERFVHVAIAGLTGSGIETLLGPARARGYEVTRSTYLLADSPLHPARPLAVELCIRHVDTPARWQLMRAFDDANDRDEPWYTPVASAMLSDRRARVSRSVGITWLYVSPRDDEQMLAKLGVFAMTTADGAVVGRLQDVATRPDHRRRGLATALVAAALEEVLVHRAGRAMYVSAHTDDMPIRMYRGHGFRDLGVHYQLFRMRTQGV